MRQIVVFDDWKPLASLGAGSLLRFICGAVSTGAIAPKRVPRLPEWLWTAGILTPILCRRIFKEECRYTNNGSPQSKILRMTNSLSKTDLKEHRQQFPGLTNKTYFNFGGQGTMPEASLQAIIDTHRHIQAVGPFSGQINSWLNAKVNLLRQAIALELAAAPETITLTENVTA
ncbi:MAG: hypothetical protein AAFO85_21910, partial [Cyanobacteria bacterium J06598_4]